MGPDMIAHIFTIWELISQLHRTSATQGFLAGFFFVYFGLFHNALFVQVPTRHMNCLGITFLITRTSVAQKNRFRIICLIISWPPTLSESCI